jgi:hypothetical protein
MLPRMQSASRFPHDWEIGLDLIWKDYNTEFSLRQACKCKIFNIEKNVNILAKLRSIPVD